MTDQPTPEALAAARNIETMVSEELAEHGTVEVEAAVPLWAQVIDNHTKARIRELEAERDALAVDAERTRSWEGFMSLLDEHYPASIFTGCSGDPGPRIVALVRENEAQRVELECAQQEVRLLRSSHEFNQNERACLQANINLVANLVAGESGNTDAEQVQSVVRERNAMHAVVGAARLAEADLILLVNQAMLRGKSDAPTHPVAWRRIADKLRAALAKLD